jgi:hypothetical protein
MLYTSFKIQLKPKSEFLWKKRTIPHNGLADYPRVTTQTSQMYPKQK